MWWPLRRRRGRGSGRVVFIGPDGPDAPWDREDAIALHDAWTALSELDATAVTFEPAPTETLSEVVAPSAPPIWEPETEPEPTPASEFAASDPNVGSGATALADLAREVAELERAAAGPTPPIEPDTPTQPAVWLGFADGSRLSLSPEDPAAIALRAVARRLTAVGSDS